MTIKNADMPAMPTHDVFEDCGMDGNSGPHLTQTTSYGLTKREMMAMHIASGFAADKEVSPCNIANMAIEVADALLAELGRTK